MSQQGGPPQAGFNPYAVGAQPGGQPDPSARLLGIINDANVGTGMSLNNLGVLKGNVPGGIASQKDRGFIGTLEKNLGIRTKVKFEGFENIGPASSASQGHDAAASPMYGSDMTPISAPTSASDGSSGGGGGGNATYEQIYGAGMTIYQNGAVHMGFSPESILGGIEPPNTPGMGRSQEKGKGGGFGLG